MIDTHAHLTEKPLYNNLAEVLNRAQENGVEKIICVGMNKRANERAVRLANNYPQIYGGVGIHPNEVMNEELDLKRLKEQLNQPKVVAIGEIGIDLYRNKETFSQQKAYFITQIKLALEFDLPIIVHSRSSASEIYEIVKEFKGLKGVMHCYSEEEQLVEKFVELGFYFGIGGIVTFKNAHEVQRIAQKIPLERLLIETDAPYLAPMPYRGKSNEPSYVKYTLLELAKIRNLKPEKLIEITNENTYRLFSKMDAKKLNLW